MVLQSLAVVSKCTVFPDQESTLGDLKLSISDLNMLSFYSIQKGVLFTNPPFPITQLISLLKCTLSQTLTHFPPLAGRLITDADGYIYITCNDAGVDFIHANGSHIHVADLLGSADGDVPEAVMGCFALNETLNYEGHFRPMLAVQVTELVDGVFIGCSINHAVVDGTSFWNFFNTFAELSRGLKRISGTPDFSRDSVLISPVVLKLPDGGPQVTFSGDAPIRERIFKFSRESILKLKNAVCRETHHTNPTAQISSFQSLCALVWRGIIRAKKLPASKTTTFQMPVNCRHRLEPKLEPLYFGNAVQCIHTRAFAGDVLSKDLRWWAEQLNKNVVAFDYAAVRKNVEDWERDPQCFPLGNLDGAMVTISSSPRFPMYENDFGWGRPVAVLSGRANKFDGIVSALPGREGGGSIDLEVILAPESMAGLESDPEFMQYANK